ncbi:MAG: dTDP-4-dehydrorhamnose 3,5-epimerase [Vulcanimicrobiaceae bacterium]
MSDHFDVVRTPIDGALLLHPRVFSDERGCFLEIFSRDRYREAGIGEPFVQDNLSSSKRGVLRGLHGDPRMSKLVQSVAGDAYDVIVDLRASSPTYRRWFGLTLRASERTQLYVPAGCLHGFLALSDETLFLYKQSALYDPACEFGVAWNDPDLAIEWPAAGSPPVLSAKDAANPTLRELGRL